MLPQPRFQPTASLAHSIHLFPHPTSPPFLAPRLSHICVQPKKDDFGNEAGYGGVDPKDLWGPEGWCQADQPKYICPCILVSNRAVSAGCPAIAAVSYCLL